LYSPVAGPPGGWSLCRVCRQNLLLSESARLEVARGSGVLPGRHGSCCSQCNGSLWVALHVAHAEQPWAGRAYRGLLFCAKLEVLWVFAHQRAQPSTSDSSSNHRGPGPSRSGCVRPLAEGDVVCWAAAMAGEKERSARVVNPQNSNWKRGLGR
jgi:hypothetical protein